MLSLFLCAAIIHVQGAHGFVVLGNDDNDGGICSDISTTSRKLPSPLEVYEPTSIAPHSLPAVFHTTIQFPGYPELMQLVDDADDDAVDAEGGFLSLASEPFEVPLPPAVPATAATAAAPQFRIKLYFNKEAEVAVYLQLHAPDDDDDVDEPRCNYYDATFSIRSRQFDLEWKAGARFAPKGTKGGCGSSDECGSTLLSLTARQLALAGFRPRRDGTDNKQRQRQLAVEVGIVIHDTGTMLIGSRRTASTDVPASARGDNDIAPLWKATVDSLRMQDARWARPSPRDLDDATSSSAPSNDNRLRVGNVVIPLLEVEADKTNQFDMDRRLKLLVASFFSGTMLGGDSRNAPGFLRSPMHNIMFDKGVYPGVEYRILRIIGKGGEDGTPDEGGDERDLFFDEAGADYVLQPICALPPGMERRWPARINEELIPNLISSLQYNVMTAIGALSASASILTFFFSLSLFTSLFFIPSCSMDPTLRVGDVLLVEKMTPRLPFNTYEKGDVVLFHPPPALQEIVALTGGRITDRDLFVKRVAGLPGDRVRVEPGGSVLINGKAPAERRDLCKEEPLGLINRYIVPGDTVVEPGHLLLMGDCSSVSVDGRVWGSIDTDYIVGRPMVRTWPTDRMALRIPDLPKGGSTSTLPPSSSAATAQ